MNKIVDTLGLAAIALIVVAGLARAGYFDPVRPILIDCKSPIINLSFPLVKHSKGDKS